MRKLSSVSIVQKSFKSLANKRVEFYSYSPPQDTHDDEWGGMVIFYIDTVRYEYIVDKDVVYEFVLPFQKIKKPSQTETWNFLNIIKNKALYYSVNRGEWKKTSEEPEAIQLNLFK